MKSGSTTKRTQGKTPIDWSRFDAMSDAQRHRAAMSDPDSRPLSLDDMQHMKRKSRSAIIRRALGLTQEQFAAHFQIPVGTLRDWEQGRKEPDQAARSYLKVIAKDPAAVRRALETEKI